MKKLIIAFLLLAIPIIASAQGYDFILRRGFGGEAILDSVDGLGVYPEPGDSTFRFLIENEGFTEKGILLFHVVWDTLETSHGGGEPDSTNKLTMCYRPCIGTSVEDTLQSSAGANILWTFAQVYNGPGVAAVDFDGLTLTPGIPVMAKVQMNGLPWRGIEIRFIENGQGDGDSTRVRFNCDLD